MTTGQKNGSGKILVACAAIAIAGLAVWTLFKPAHHSAGGSPDLQLTDTSANSPRVAPAAVNSYRQAATLSPMPAQSTEHDEAALAASVTAENEARWTADPQDAVKSAAMERALHDMLASPAMTGLAKPVSIEPACKSSMCRVDATFDMMGSGEWITMLALQGATQFPVLRNVTVPMPGGRSREIVYFYSKGAVPPR